MSPRRKKLSFGFGRVTARADVCVLSLTMITVKWLGPGAVNPLLVDGKGGKAELIPAVRRWVAATGRSVTLPVMIVSYETLRTLEDELAGAPVGLLLADEGHRLKNAGE